MKQTYISPQSEVFHLSMESFVMQSQVIPNPEGLILTDDFGWGVEDFAL